jgi:hypothetical protein
MKYIILTGLLFALLFLSFGCCGTTSNTTSNLGNQGISPNPSSTSTDFCPNFIVPPDVIPEKNNGSSTFVLSRAQLDRVDWNGWTQSVWETPCRNGKKTGENAAYLYCIDAMVNPSNNYLSTPKVSRTFTDSSGNIIDNRVYALRWVFAPKDAGWQLKEIRFYPPSLEALQTESTTCIRAYN